MLTIANHTGSWHYQADTGPHTSCSSAQSGATATLTGLTAGTTYTYKAYSDSGCTTANLVATASAFTTAITVGNLGETGSLTTLTVDSGKAFGQAFTTGSATNGYTLKSATLDFGTVVTASAITVSIRSEASNQPGSTDLATLSGTPASGQTTFNCSGSGCNLSASTTYYVYVAATSAAATINTTASDTETLAPSTNGWSIANAVRQQQGGWGEHTGGVSMKVELEAVAR